MLHIAVSMDCAQCQVHCCGLLPHCRPVLMPWETPDQFFGLVERKGKIRIIRQRKTGHCIFLDENCRCAIYDRRPLECRLFPFKLQFSRNNVRLEVDQRCKQHTLFSQLSANRLMEGLAGQKFPAAWVSQYVAYQE
jgi:Fe-S-cluster containining protein